MTRTVSAFAAVFPDWEAADIQARAKNTPLHSNIDSVLANLRPGKVVAEVEFDVPDDAVFLIAHPLGGPVIHGTDLEDVIDAGVADLPELAEPFGVVMVSAASTVHAPSFTRRIRTAIGQPDLETALPLNNFAAFIDSVFEDDHVLPPMKKVPQ